jgi:dihydroflavonol-4-reductase
MRTALVTGGTGLVGSNLVHALVEDGARVRVLCRTGSDLRGIAGTDAEVVYGDVRDPDAVGRAIKGCDTVFHAAAIISHWPKERPAMHDINVRGTAVVVEACMRSNVEKVVHTSSIATIGPAVHDNVMTEDTPYDPGSYPVGYRASKHAAEQDILRRVGHGLPAVIVNPAVIMGRRDYRFHGGRIIRDVVRRRIFYAPAGGTNIVSVDDVVAGHLAAARLGRVGERYILAGENRSFEEIFGITAEETGGIAPQFNIPRSVVWGVAALVEGGARVLGTRPWVTRELVAGIGSFRRYSSEKARHELGYTYRSFRATVRETYAWYREEGLL